MNRATLAIGTTAVVVAAAALYFGISNSSSNVGPSPTPAVTATPSVSGSPLPTELQSRWFGGHRDIVQLDKGSTIDFTAGGFVMNEANRVGLHPSPELVGFGYRQWPASP